MANLKKAAKKAPPPLASDPALPLFFRKPAVLDKRRHAKAGIRSIDNLAFAADANSMPLNTVEFLEASKHYPIVFTADHQPAPIALVGMESTNYFVDAKGQWKDETYIPAYVRQYPFIFFQPPEGDLSYLCVDEKAEYYINPAGKNDARFFDKGEPAALTNNALKFCMSFYQQMAITHSFCADLAKHKLLMPYHLKATTKSGREIALSGFTMIDEKAFNTLSDEVFLEFRSKGWLAFIYLALASATNWKQLLAFANQRD